MVASTSRGPTTSSSPWATNEVDLIAKVAEAPHWITGGYVEPG